MPDQSPLAAQIVAPVEDQVRVDATPLVTLVGLALIETVAAKAAVTPNDNATLSASPAVSGAHGLTCTDDQAG